MLLRRFLSLLLLLAVSTAPVSHAIETTSATKTHPTKPLPNPDGTIKKAPPAKPYKTKKTRKSKHTSKSTSSKTASTNSAPTPRSGTTPTKTVVSLHPKSPAVVLSREAITQRIEQSLATPKLGIENPRALQPFFDQLHLLAADTKAQLVRVIQFGDSHTAGDSFTGALRTLFQQKFGDGGAGFQFAGYPFAGYHIHGTKRAQSTGWLALGTHLNDIGDAMVGMGGVSLSTAAAGNWVSLDADATSLQVQYLVQPNGGFIEIRDNDTLIATVSTASTDTLAPDTAGHFDAPVEPGPHHFEVLTTDQAPVRLLGLSTENSAGITYEAVGINGAEASLFLRWNEVLQQTLMLESNPALIVLSYGTNEAGDRNWTEVGYAAMFQRIIERCRRLAPNASILVIGPPDRAMRAGRRAWKPFTGVDRIVAAQRSVCRQMHCAYWDQRSRMEDYSSMRDWDSISWAQPDHTHFTGEGYTELASALFSDIVQQYDTYETPLTRAQGETK
jgi:lysophospholipase L1-like esterase